MQWVAALNVPIDMQWGMYPLYESVSGTVQSPNGLSDVVASTIRVKRGFPHYHPLSSVTI